VARLAEARIAIEVLADWRTKDTVVIVSADDDAGGAVSTFFEHEFAP